MSTIREYATSNYYGSQYPDSDWSSKAKQNANSFLSGLSINTDTGCGGTGAISLSAAGAGGTYTSSGRYSSALSELVSSHINTAK